MYKFTRFEDAYEYEGKGHFKCHCIRLHDPKDVNEGSIVHGITTFLPGGGSNGGVAEFEMIYHTLDGEMTVYMKNEGDTEETEYVMHAGDSMYFGKGTFRRLMNNSKDVVHMMTIMVRPQ